MAMNKTSFQSLHLEELDPEFHALHVNDESLHEQPEVKSFEFQDLYREHLPVYSDVKSRYGSLAITDSERLEKSVKDRRFHLHQHVKHSLCVEDEELRVIQERVHQEVQVVSESARKDGFSQGYEEGVRQGREAAYQEIKAQGETQLGQVRELLRALESAKSEIYRANEKVLIQLMFRIGKMILLRELKEDPQYIQRLVQNLMKEASPQEYLVIRVNPDDLESIQLLEPEFKRTLRQLNQMKIEGSAQIPIGGCQVETEWLHIETHIQSQLKAIEVALWGGGDES